MLVFEGKEFRNLEEQVLKNKEDIAKHYEIDRALANLGIKVVGQVELPSQLPDALTYQGEFGDTYAVGNPEEVAEGTGFYEYYVFTRPDENAGTPTNHWLNVGRISIVGPQGPRGQQGIQGEIGESTRWYYGSVGPEVGPGYEYIEGDMWLDSSGNVYRYNGNLWDLTTNIKGPQGVQGIRGQQGERGEQGPVGPQGPQGDVGGFINIWGTLSNTNQLPLPSTLNNLTAAYLVEHTGGTDQSNDHYDLYIQVGETSATAVWTNAGPFNAATLVTQGGVGLNVWNADTKLDKDSSVTTYNQVYVKAANGGQAAINVTKQLVADCITQRKSDTNITVPATPTSNTDAASKTYVDTQVGNCVQKISGATTYAQVYGKTAAGTQLPLDVSRSVIASAIPQRQTNGNIRVPNVPTADNDAASKEYVDNSSTYCEYTEYTGGTVYLLDVEGYYMIYSTSDNADIKIYSTDGDIITGAKQLQFIAATQTKYPTGNFKLCGIKYGGSSYDVESFRRAAPRGAFITAPGGFAICQMTKPLIEEEL